MTAPHIRLHAAGHDRLSLRRTDQDWLASAWPTGQVLVVSEARIERPVTWVEASQAPAGQRILLGQRDSVTHWAVITDEPVDRPDHWVRLRDLIDDLAVDPTDASLIFHALGIAEWLRATRFCARCGRRLQVTAAGHQLTCEAGHATFPRTDPAVIMLITADGGERALLGRHTRWGDQPRFSTLAGFCEPGETLEDAVRREVDEEAGVAVGAVNYVGNQPWPLPSSLMLGFTGEALSTDLDLRDGELAEARWFTRDGLREDIATGRVVIPGPVSISRSLIDDWLDGA